MSVLSNAMEIVWKQWQRNRINNEDMIDLNVETVAAARLIEDLKVTLEEEGLGQLDIVARANRFLNPREVTTD